MNTINANSLIKLVLHEKEISMTDLSEKLKTSQQNLWHKVTNVNSIKLKTFIEILEACDEKLVIELKNGNKFNVKL